ncbi:NmrA-like family protein [Basidiobolus meristosporus CBS 931.73]|uniref:NmrA-like family protein n=1 Tax=Basidiobolus meristosporus CBS 931.73 TaxID=1314790 RepID=A0A1Y1XJT8_9FUNG|nr:NmrA-like family protein [Basidiobolus meristosporus CBS 931.73]|eukprot:ORX86011.1 NmrA-like family protein [Basidiobolus meristosporus CBS 931.73]
MGKVILTGATGKLGSVVLKHLLKLITPSDIVVSVYNPQGHETLRSQGVELRPGNFDKPEGLMSTFSGGDKLLLISLPTIDDEYRTKTQMGVIDAAKKAGIKHIYYTSLAYLDGSVASVMRSHFATEDYLKSSGVDYTIIREGSYMESYPAYLGFFETSSGEVIIPGDGRIAFADRNELGEATAKIIAGNEYTNQTVTLTGARAYTLQETTDLLSSYLGIPISFRKVSDSEWLEHNADKRALAEWWISSYTSIERGDCAQVYPDLERLLGRKPTSLEEFLQQRLVDKNSGDQELSEWANH